MTTKLTPTFVLAVLLLSVCTTAYAQEETKTVTFAEFKGKVVDSRGKPIEKFKVIVTFYDYSKEAGMLSLRL